MSEKALEMSEKALVMMKNKTWSQGKQQRQQFACNWKTLQGIVPTVCFFLFLFYQHSLKANQKHNTKTANIIIYGDS